jgi:hypothetical protein
MKICRIIPIAHDGRKIDVVSYNLSIPDISHDCDTFLQSTTDIIIEVMTANSVDCVKIAYGAELPEYQTFADASALPLNDDWRREVIRAALFAIIKSRTRGELK